MATKLLIIGTVFPEPNSSAAGSRMMQLIELFLQQGWEVTFASSAAESPFSESLEPLGVKQVSVKLNCSSFNEFVADFNPEFVVFDRFMTEEQFGWRVAKTCPSAIRILDTEDLHCLRSARQKRVKQSRAFQKADLLKEEVALREIASIYRCDLSLIISEFEMDVLKSTFKVEETLLYYLPFMLETVSQSEVSKWSTFTDRQHFVTIGNFLHPPNWDAVQYLKSAIWPLIRKELSEAEMHVYGAYCTDKHLQLHSEKEGFLVLGRAKDAVEVISNAKVLLAPIRYGAGLKGKLVEAMQSGTPSVTTPIGAEAMHKNLPWSGIIADEPKAFAQEAVELYTNQSAWEMAQKNGLEIINQLYSKQEIGALFLERLASLKSNLETYRNRNFIGSMLMHHTMRSTEFMSRWIELKNKR